MKSEYFESPTIVLITDRTDLDDQLSAQFINAKSFIGDNTVESVESRADLRDKLQGRQSGGVFLTTIHKFTEDTELLTDTKQCDLYFRRSTPQSGKPRPKNKSILKKVLQKLLVLPNTCTIHYPMPLM